jgi:uncharacterized membrane protein YedE/YeeE
MGIGAVLAGGCTVGQGITGLATASVTSFVAVAGIVSGMLVGLRFLSWSSDIGTSAAGRRSATARAAS